MAKTRDSYRVTGNSAQELVTSLNFLLQRLADRIDRIEGIRGTASIESDLEMNSNRIKELGEGADNTDGARLDDILTEPLNLTTLTVSDDTTLNDATVEGGLVFVDANGTTLHSFGVI